MPDSQTSALFPRLFQVLALAGLISVSLWIMRPFLVPLFWALTVVIATWPVLLRAQAILAGKRPLAVLLMTLALLSVFVIPFYFAITTVAENIERVADLSKSLSSLALAGPPSWLQTVPLIGMRATQRWRELADSGSAEIAKELAPYARALALWFVALTGNLGLLFVQFLLTTIIAAILYANGELGARAVLRFAKRLAGTEGEKIAALAAQSVRSVAMGIVVTALLQTLLAGLGLSFAGVPFAAFFTGAIFILAIAQIGPAIILIGATIWVYAEKGPVWGTCFLAWSIFCSTFDNFLRPLLIKRGADLPLLLVFAGVIGGLLSFGVIGLFIGPVVLAVAYTLLVDWVADGD
jgi:predicted PurR-regulated permease PerM